MRLATAVLIFGAGLVALTHHDAPAVPSAARPAKHRTVTLHASRSMRRRHLPAVPHRVDRRRQVATPPTIAPIVPPALHDWSGVAQCESGGDWHINTGNSFYGGLQFTLSTWLVFGGGHYAPRADLATPAQQITIAERVLASQGPGAWPICSKYL
jgi:hypothetical protein